MGPTASSSIKNARACLLLLGTWALFSSFASYAFGPAIRYSGFTIDQVINFSQSDSPAEADPEYCLGIVESSPFESKKVYYSQRQFIDLVRRNPFIADHLGKKLELNLQKFTAYLVQRHPEGSLRSRCLGLGDIIKFRMHEQNEHFEDVTENLRPLWQDLHKCSSLIFHSSRPSTVSSRPDDFVIRYYDDPRMEWRRSWRDDRWDETSIRSMDDIDEFLKLANKFLLNYRTVSNLRGRPRIKRENYVEYDEESVEHHLIESDINIEEMDDETLIGELASFKGMGAEDFKRNFAKRFSLSLDEFIQHVRKNFNITKKEAKEVQDALDAQEEKESEKLGRLFQRVLERSLKDDETNQVAADHPWPRPVRTYHASGDMGGIRSLVINFRTWLKNKSIKRASRHFNPKVSFEVDKLEDPQALQAPFLDWIRREDERLRLRMSKMENVQRRRPVQNSSAMKYPHSQDPQDRLDYLQSKLEGAESDGGPPLTSQELEEYRKLQAQMVLGLNDFKDIKGSSSWKRKLYFPFKKIFQNYNKYGTDTVVDVMTDKTVNASLEQLRPLGKNRTRIFRAVKGLDGAFVLSTTVAGLALAPFTFGLSVVAAEAIKVSMTSLFSVGASLAKGESLDSTLLRASVRAGHAMVEGLVPGLGDANAFFTSIDDLRVAFKLHEWFNRLRKGKKGVVKARWETLGEPLVLAFLRERLNYVTQGLLPRGKFFYAYAKLPFAKKVQLRRVLKQLHQARLYLYQALHESRLRYEYLLKSGKIPEFMLKEVIVQLAREEHFDYLASLPQFQEGKFMEEMKGQLREKVQ